MPDQRFSIDVEPVYEFLDELRESAITNMFGATPYIVDEFEVSRQEAGLLLTSWMGSYETRHPD